MAIVGAAAGSGASILLAIVGSITLSQDSQISFLVGSVGTVLGATFGAGASILSRLDELERRRASADKLSRLAQIPEAQQEIVSLVDHLMQLNQSNDSYSALFWNRALTLVCENRMQVSELAAGHLVCSGKQEIYFVRNAISRTKREVRAVAARGLAWWLKPEADAYWTVYAEAARRLSIRRIFVVDGFDDPQVHRVLDRHAGLGMKTFVIRADAIPQMIRKPIVIFDSGLLHRSFAGQSLEDEQVEFTDDWRAISRAIDDFNLILSLKDTQEWQPLAK